MTVDATGNYDAAYHAALRAGSRRSAAAVLTRVQALVAPASIVDFGCGSGGWLVEAGALGIADRAGVDGPWVDVETLEIDPAIFTPVDLTAPLDLGRRFDLALCLEVAEHLPESAAPVLIDTLCAHAPVLVFSAAIPGQGGEGHVNEAWPSFWCGLFAARGFQAHDALRAAFWQDGNVEPWYRQNLLIFAERGHLAHHEALAQKLRDAVAGPLDIVHPAFFEGHRELATAYEREAASHAALLDSTSWRMTAPLRALARWLRARRSGDA